MAAFRQPQASVCVCADCALGRGCDLVVVGRGHACLYEIKGGSLGISDVEDAIKQLEECASLVKGNLGVAGARLHMFIVHDVRGGGSLNSLASSLIKMYMRGRGVMYVRVEKGRADELARAVSFYYQKCYDCSVKEDEGCGLTCPPASGREG